MSPESAVRFPCWFLCRNNRGDTNGFAQAGGDSAVLYASPATLADPTAALPRRLRVGSLLRPHHYAIRPHDHLRPSSVAARCCSQGAFGVKTAIIRSRNVSSLSQACRINYATTLRCLFWEYTGKATFAVQRKAPEIPHSHTPFMYLLTSNSLLILTHTESIFGRRAGIRQLFSQSPDTML